MKNKIEKLENKKYDGEEDFNSAIFFKINELIEWLNGMSEHIGEEEREEHNKEEEPKECDHDWKLTEFGILYCFRCGNGKDLPKKWKPENGEKYWYIDEYGYVYESNWRNDIVDSKRHNFGNVFPDEETAKKYREIIKKVLTNRFE